MIKLVASDLDGTIIDKNNSIYENNFNYCFRQYD